MIGTKVEKALNDQIREELYSAYLYLQMSAWFTTIDLHGFANWMRVQCQEEMVHASIFFDHVLTRNGSAVLQAISAPPAKWDSPLAAIEAALKHEQHITACIYKLVDVANANRDYAATAMLQWFITEQVEEEANADGIIRKLKLIGSDKGGMYLLDRELGTRVFTPPAVAAAGAAPPAPGA